MHIEWKNVAALINCLGSAYNRLFDSIAACFCQELEGNGGRTGIGDIHVVITFCGPTKKGAMPGLTQTTHFLY
jgi:hypothetical protein